FRTLSLPTARLGCAGENGLKRNVTLHGSCDHDWCSKKAFQEFSKQRDAYLNSFWFDAVQDHTQKVVVGDQVQNSVDERLLPQFGCDPAVSAGCFGRSFVFKPKPHFSAFRFHGYDGIVILGVPELCQVVLGADLGGGCPSQQDVCLCQGKVQIVQVQPVGATPLAGFHADPSREQFPHVD